MRANKAFVQGPRGGYYGHFWKGDFKFIAHNEGGAGLLVYNLKLWKGWFPVGFYLSVGVGSRRFRFSKGFSL